MQKMRFLVRNVADTASLVVVPAAVSTSLAVTNLQRQTERARTWRSSSTAAQALALLWTADQKVNCCGFTRHNWTTASTLRTRLYPAGSPSAVAYDSTALPGFSTSGLDTDIDTYTDADFRMLRNTMQYFTRLDTVQAAVLDITDAANADGYIEANRLWMGKYFECTYDPPFGGAELQLVDSSMAGRASDGTHVVDKGYKHRKLTLKTEFIPDADLATLLATARYCGKDKELFVDLYPDDTGVKGLYNKMACRFVDSPTFTPYQRDLHRSQFVLEET